MKRNVIFITFFLLSFSQLNFSSQLVPEEISEQFSFCNETCFLSCSSFKNETSVFNECNLQWKLCNCTAIDQTSFLGSFKPSQQVFFVYMIIVGALVTCCCGAYYTQELWLRITGKKSKPVNKPKFKVYVVSLKYNV